MNDAEASSSSAPPSVSSEDVSDMFIKHKVNKLDNLAGLAIKYNVSVADIKRANGLLSDSAMFGRETILIPTQQLPLGEDVQMMVAQIFSGVGRDKLLNADARLTPGSAAAAMARANGSAAAAAGDRGAGPSDPGGDLSWLASCGGICGDMLPEPPSSPSQRRYGGVLEPGDVELMDRSPKAQSAHAAIARAEELTRRRRQAGDTNGEILPDPMAPPMQEQVHRNGYSSRRPPGAPPPNSAAGKTFWNNMSHLSKAVADSAFVQRIKKVASQPALAGPTATASFGGAADAVLASLRAPSGSRGDRPASASAAMPPPRNKEGGKAD